MSDSKETPYKLTLVGPGLKVEKPIEEAKALGVLQIALGGVPAEFDGIARPTTPTVGRGLRPGQPLSLREYVEEFGGSTYSAKIVTIGRYLRDHEQKNDFSRDEIKARFRTAGEALPKNLPRDFQTAIQAGWIAPDHEKAGRFYVTRRGDEAAENKFLGTPLPKARSRSKNDRLEE
jgi:hypothetical protein